MRIRPEAAADVAAVRHVNQTAFDTSAEADLVDALRERAEPLVSLVADEGGTVVGHILFSPVTLPGRAEPQIMGLAPMAVLPAWQRRGIGSALVGAGLESCKGLGFGAVVVLGHPTYYPRFGFVPASSFGLACEYDVPDEAFMAVELEEGALRGASGTIRYHPAFPRPERVVVRPLRTDEGRQYLEIVRRAIRGIAAGHYPREAIEGWLPRVTEDTLRDLMANADNEVRLVAELDGVVSGIGALVVERSELRACYVVPEAARRGCGAALVREIERLAREHGLTRLELAASLNAEAFYAAQGYGVRERSSVVLGNGHHLACVWMDKQL